MKTFALAAFLALALTATGTVSAFADNSYAESVWKRLSETSG
mgnify:CR=1 FL=1